MLDGGEGWVSLSEMASFKLNIYIQTYVKGTGEVERGIRLFIDLSFLIHFPSPLLLTPQYSQCRLNIFYRYVCVCDDTNYMIMV